MKKNGSSEKENRTMERIGRIVDAIPLALIAGLSGFSLVAMILLLTGQFRTELLWTFGPIVAVLFGWIVVRFGQVDRPGGQKERLICDLLVLAGVVIWGGYNSLFTSQHILTDRDPATYAVTAAWLSQNDNLSTKAPSMLNGVKGVSSTSAGFSLDKQTGVLFAQGQHILPALLGAVGKIVGPKNVLHFNVLFGMTALLALYCFGRLFMRPYWALVGMAVVACSLPFLYFSRDTYTEPLAATFTFGGLAVLWSAQKNRQALLWILAGAIMGAGVLTRVDGYLTLIGAAAFLAVYTAFANKKEEQRLRIKEAVIFALPAAGMSLLAWLDLKLLSAHYYKDTLPLVLQELTMLAGIVIVGIIMNVVRMKYDNIRKWLDRATINWRAMAAALLVLAVGVLLVSRPIWQTHMQSTQNLLVAGIQQAEYSKVEPRDYAELTTYWVSWYIGPIMATLGLVGFAYAAYKSMTDRKMILLGALFVILGTSLVYFVKPSITPDQIWASRRMLPVIMPGITIFGVYALSLLADKIKLPSMFFKRSVMGLAAVGLIIAPLTVSGFFLKVRDTTEYAFVVGLCENLPKNAVVVWLGLGRLQAVQPTVTYCHVEAYGYSLKQVDKPTPSKLAEIAKTARSHGKVPYLGVYTEQLKGLVEPTEYKKFTQVSDAHFVQISQSLTAPPKRIIESDTAASLAIIKDNGSLQKIKK